MLSPAHFKDLLVSIEDLTPSQTFEVLLHMRELGAGDINPLKEALASFNALTELEIVHFFSEIKNQFDTETLKALVE